MDLLTTLLQEQADLIADFVYGQIEEGAQAIAPLVACSIKSWFLWAPVISLEPPTVLSRLVARVNPADREIL